VRKPAAPGIFAQIDFAEIDPILPPSIFPPSILDRNSGREVLEPVHLIPVTRWPLSRDSIPARYRREA
jgi:hypothetical protein